MTIGKLKVNRKILTYLAVLRSKDQVTARVLLSIKNAIDKKCNIVFIKIKVITGSVLGILKIESTSLNAESYRSVKLGKNGKIP